MTRSKTYHLKLSEAELARLAELAGAAELKQSDYLRGLIKREWEARRRTEDVAFVFGPTK